jgi:hypothetical protein
MATTRPQDLHAWSGRPEPHTDEDCLDDGGFDDAYNYWVEERAEIPYTDALSAWLVKDAVETLATVRSPWGPADPRTALSCLASLVVESEGGLDDAVYRAIEGGYGWDDVAMALEETTEAVQERYGSYVVWRATEDVALPPAPPVADQLSAHALEGAVTSLVKQRFPLSLSDGTAVLNALASLVAQAHVGMAAAVADARDQHHSWEDIAICLGVTPATARRRYAANVRNRQEPPLDD